MSRSKRRGGPALLRGQAGIDLRPAELHHLLHLGRRVLPVERPQRLQQPVGPAAGGVAVVAEDLELSPDVAGQLRAAPAPAADCAAAFSASCCAQMGLQRGRGDHLQHALLTERVGCHEGMKTGKSLRNG